MGITRPSPILSYSKHLIGSSAGVMGLLSLPQIMGYMVSSAYAQDSALWVLAFSPRKEVQKRGNLSLWGLQGLTLSLELKVHHQNPKSFTTGTRSFYSVNLTGNQPQAAMNVQHQYLS